MQIFSYQGLLSSSEGSYHESGSKFLAYAFPIANRKELEDRLAEIKTLHPKARHHCYAYRLLEREEVTEYASDAGEPSGTAGQPILGELRRHQLINVIVIVVRYFGGTKLGIPGLIHAYHESTSESIKVNQIITISRKVTYEAIMPLGLQPKFYSACKHYDIELDQPTYTDRFQAMIKVPMENSEHTLDRLLSLIAGQEGNMQALAQLLDISLRRNE